MPPNCGVVVELAATATPGIPDTGWYPHDFGEIASSPNAPHAVWESQFSEVPFNPGFLDCEMVPGRKGLFTILIQRAQHVVKTLRGRYLHVRVHLFGDGRSTPEIAALRAYGPRFSYIEHYLPHLYHETKFGADADALATADQLSTQADFLERFIDIFEGVLTPLEGRIASSYLLTDPRSTPDEALDWLGTWLGVTFDPEMPLDIRRDLLQQTPQLYRRWGTFDGLRLALNILTRGGVASGEIVVLEDYRLRRTFATILGADLADEDNPLLAGIVRSGNSFVGDTLILGEEWRKEFLALYSADLPTSQREEDAIERLFDELAHRATVIVHQDMTPLDVRLIRRVVNIAAPAHVLARVLTSTTQFIVGMAALIGVDTYPGTHPERQPVRVERSQIGVRDYIQALPSLDPRLESGRRQTGLLETDPPVARLSGPEGDVELGDDITLDGSDSSAAPGRSITGFNWTHRNESSDN
jgi:phage tail-like protein